MMSEDQKHFWRGVTIVCFAIALLIAIIFAAAWNSESVRIQSKDETASYPVRYVLTVERANGDTWMVQVPYDFYQAHHVGEWLDGIRKENNQFFGAVEIEEIAP